MAKKQSMKYLGAMTSTDSNTTVWQAEETALFKLLPPGELMP